MTCSADLSGAARSLLVRVGGRTLFDDVNPYLSRLNAASQLPTELLPEAYLSVHRDWHALNRRQVLGVLLMLERANAAIVAQHKEAAEAQASRRPHPPRGKPKRTHAGGRR